MNNQKNIVFLFRLAAFPVLLFCFFVQNASAKNFDIYVDKGVKAEGDGSKESPYETISQALTEALSKSVDKRNIFVAKGVYDESLLLGDSMYISGAGRGKTIITGDVLVEKKSGLENLTIKTEKLVAIMVNGQADFSLQNIEVSGFRKIGLQAIPGEGKIILKNIAIHGSSGKGLYIQKGHRLEISDSRIYKNAEEGVDVRNNVDGFIKNNALYENGEGGMEIIVGDADMVISNNKFTQNAASGIAVQFYATANTDGQIEISNNTITNNGKYGLGCNVPSGGKPGLNYWKRSINLENNTIESNKRKEINPFCKIIDAVDANEELDNKIKETDPDDPINNGMKNEKFTAVNVTVLSNEDLEKERIIWEQVELMATGIEAREIAIDDLGVKIQNLNKLKLFFFGVKKEYLEKSKEEIRQSKEIIENLRSLLTQAQSFQNHEEVQSFIQEEEVEIVKHEAFIREQEEENGILGWRKYVAF